MPTSNKHSIEDVKDALTRGGNVSRAAELLGCHQTTLRRRIKGTKELTDFMQMPTEAVKINRGEKLVETPYTSEEEIVKALEREEGVLKKGLTSMGLAGRELEEAIALQAFVNKNITTVYDLIAAGLAKDIVQLGAMASETSEEIRETAGMDIERESMLRTDRWRLIQEKGKAQERAYKALMAKALLAQRQEDASKGGGPKGKPGFTPIQNNIAIKTNNLTVEST
jgi:transposase-like protein